MQRVKVYGVMASSIFRTYKQSCYFYKLADVMEVANFLSEQENSKRLDRHYLPFSTTLQSLEYYQRLVQKDRTIKSAVDKVRLERQLGINNYRVFESASEYFASLERSISAQSGVSSESTELEINEK